MKFFHITSWAFSSQFSGKIPLSIAIALVTSSKVPESTFFVANSPRPLFPDLLICIGPMNSAKPGDFPRNPFRTQSERSKAPVLDKCSSFLHFSTYPFRFSEFPLTCGSNKAVLKHSNADEYLLRFSRILPLQRRVLKWVLSIFKASSQSLKASSKILSLDRASALLQRAKQRDF
uniref:Uncharacterized protein n=1 Tax=Cucumis sativus TaxID=3659 RepID=A0A0A0KW16_CUCSA